MFCQHQDHFSDCFSMRSCPERAYILGFFDPLLPSAIIFAHILVFSACAIEVQHINENSPTTECHPSWQRKIVEKKGKAQFKRQSFHVLNLRPIQVDPNDISSRLIQTSNLISRTWFLFTMFNGPECFKQVTINFSNLCISLGTWEVRRLNWA